MRYTFIDATLNFWNSPLFWRMSLEGSEMNTKKPLWRQNDNNYYFGGIWSEVFCGRFSPKTAFLVLKRPKYRKKYESILRDPFTHPPLLALKWPQNRKINAMLVARTQLNSLNWFRNDQKMEQIRSLPERLSKINITHSLRLIFFHVFFILLRGCAVAR